MRVLAQKARALDGRANGEVRGEDKPVSNQLIMRTESPGGPNCKRCSRGGRQKKTQLK